MSLVGNLEELGLGEILQIVNLSRKTGVLSLHSNGREGSIVFRLGQVVRASSSTFQESLGEVLIQKGVIDLAILRKALAFQQEEGFRDRLGTILTRNFGISGETIEEVVREQIENVVLTLFSWQDGTFEFVTSSPSDSLDGTRMDPLQLILNQGLNPQLLAMEGSRILDESNRAAEAGADAVSKDPVDPLDIDFDLVDLPPRRPYAPAPLVSKMPLVMVDDDGPTLKAVSEALRQKEYEVHAMTRSEDTLIKVDAVCRGGERPTILIDLIMPKMDGSGVLGGLELLELIHNNFTGLHIIVLSDYHHADAESRIKEMGYAFMVKPRRVELNDASIFPGFIEQLLNEIARPDTVSEPHQTQESFNLGDEMRMEMGDIEDTPASPENAANSSLSLLRGMLEELNNPDLQGGVLLLVLRFASEFLNRAIVFSVQDKVVSGAGQFGISGGKSSGDAKVRAIHFPLEADSMFRMPARKLQPVTFTPQPSAIDSHIFDQLGGGIPEEAFIGPLVSQSRIIGFLYGDNLPENRPVGDTESLSIFLSQAGFALEKSNLERQLHERGRQ